MTEKDLQIAEVRVREKLKGLDPSLTYHCLTHTFDVLDQCLRIAGAEGFTHEHDLNNLRMAALYHDTGFLETYKNHEQKGCEIFLKDTTDFDISEEDKEIIKGLIMSTKLPQEPKTRLQRVICDADLDYLGRDDFFPIADNLKKEFLHYEVVANEDEWHELQLKFLTHHSYHTASSAKLRDPVKKKHLIQIMNA